MIDNHGHIGVGEIDPEDIVEGYDPEVLRGQSPRQFISLMDAIGVERAVLHSLRPWANKHHARVLREHPGRFIGVCKIDEATVTTDEAHEALRFWEFVASLRIPVCFVSLRRNFETLWPQLLRLLDRLLPGLRENQYGPNDEVLRALFDTFGPSKMSR